MTLDRWPTIDEVRANPTVPLQEGEPMNEYPDPPPESLRCKCGRHLPCRHCELLPGSKEAVAEGCLCPVLDNAHGKGFMGIEGVFVYSGGCPIHYDHVLSPDNTPPTETT